MRKFQYRKWSDKATLFLLNSSRQFEEIFKNLDRKGTGIHINGENLNNLQFPDDIVLMNESTDELKQMILQLYRESQKIVAFNNFIHHEIKIHEEVI